MRPGVNTTALINLVRDRPVLWDKRLSRNIINTSVTKGSEWTGIFAALNPHFYTSSEVERRQFGNLVMKKWKNVKDHYVKTVKRSAKAQDEGIRRKGYVHMDQLSFLRPTVKTGDEKPEETIQPEEMPDQRPVAKRTCTTARFNKREATATTLKSSSKTTTAGFRRKVGQPRLVPSDKPKTKESTPIDVKSLLPSGTKRKHGDLSQRFPGRKQPEEDEDRYLSFFKGLLPSLHRFTEDEALEFQSGVISLIKDIRKSRFDCNNSNTSRRHFSKQSISDNNEEPPRQRPAFPFHPQPLRAYTVDSAVPDSSENIVVKTEAPESPLSGDCVGAESVVIDTAEEGDSEESALTAAFGEHDTKESQRHIKASQNDTMAPQHVTMSSQHDTMPTDTMTSQHDTMPTDTMSSQHDTMPTDTMSSQHDTMPTDTMSSQHDTMPTDTMSSQHDTMSSQNNTPSQNGSDACSNKDSYKREGIDDGGLTVFQPLSSVNENGEKL